MIQTFDQLPALGCQRRNQFRHALKPDTVEWLDVLTLLGSMPCICKLTQRFVR